ncbi:MAG: glycosyltransferase family 4 protein [Rhodoglobus sp.]
MRVLMVTPWFPTADSAESGIFVLRDALAVGAEHSVSVLHLDSASVAAARSGATTVGGVSTVRVPFNRWRPRDWSVALKAVRAAAANADVVHTHALTGIVLFAFARPGKRTRWVHTEHWSGLTAPETLSPRGRIARRALMPILGRPDAVIVACERLAMTIRTVRSKPIVTIPCVVVPPLRVAEAPRDPALLRIVGIGGIIERKGAMCALETVAELDRRGITAHLTWVGDGPQRDELEERALALGLRDRLFLTGSLSEVEVGTQLDAADLFLLPTLGDNFCIVVAEALSHGRPIVSGADTGAVDYSRPSVSRFVDDARNPVAYANAIIDLRSSTEHLSADEIAETVRDEFTPERVSRLLAETYRG